MSAIALCLGACGQASISHTTGTTKTTQTSNPSASNSTAESLQITEWYGIRFYVGTPVFTTTITDAQKIGGSWSAITSLPLVHGVAFCGGNISKVVPYDNFDFRFIQGDSVTREAKIVVMECTFWDVTSTQWTGLYHYFTGPLQFQHLWQTLHDLTGVPIPTIPQS